MSATQNSFPLSTDWQDAVATVTGAASVDAIFQNIGGQPCEVVFGGSKPSGLVRGIRLAPLDSVQGNAANVWVRSQGGTAGTDSISILVV